MIHPFFYSAESGLADSDSQPLASLEENGWPVSLPLLLASPEAIGGSNPNFQPLASLEKISLIVLIVSVYFVSYFCSLSLKISEKS